MPLRSLYPAVALVLLVLGGCSHTHSRLFEGHDASQVWTAMVAVAETPDYQTGPSRARWKVRENNVWVDEAGGRIEILRELDRVVLEPGRKPRPEKQVWRFQIWFDGAPPPLATFVTRTNAWPGSTRTEAERYFDDVARLLGTPRGPAPTSAPAPAAAAPLPPPATPDPATPPVDVDDLLDG